MKPKALALVVGFSAGILIGMIAVLVLRPSTATPLPDPGVTHGSVVNARLEQARATLRPFFPGQSPAELDATAYKVCDLIAANNGDVEATARGFAALFGGNDQSVAYNVTDIANNVTPVYCSYVAKAPER